MKKHFLIGLIAISITFFINVIPLFAETPNDAKAQIIQIVTFEGQLDDGSKEIRKRKCYSGSSLETQSGKYEDYLSYPGTPIVTINENYEGTITIPFQCRVRIKKIAGCGGFEESTEDEQKPGSIVADFNISRANKLNIKNIRGEEKYGQCGDKIIEGLNSKNDIQLNF